MAVIISMFVTDQELKEIVTNVGTMHTKTISKHVTGDGHFLKSQTASTTMPGYSQIELVLDTDFRKDLKKLGILS